jgi:hypothetical protein
MAFLSLITCRWILAAGDTVHRRRRAAAASAGEPEPVRFDDFSDVACYVCGSKPSLALLYASFIVLVGVCSCYFVLLTDFLVRIAPSLSPPAASSLVAPAVALCLLIGVACIQNLNALVSFASKGFIATACFSVFTILLALTGDADDGTAATVDTATTSCSFAGQLFRPGVFSFAALASLNFQLHNAATGFFHAHPGSLPDREQLHSSEQPAVDGKPADASLADLSRSFAHSPRPVPAVSRTLTSAFAVTYTVQVAVGEAGFFATRCGVTPEDFSLAFPESPLAQLIRCLVFFQLLCVFPIALSVSFRAFSGLLAAHGFIAVLKARRLRFFFAACILAAGFFFAAWWPHIGAILSVVGAIGAFIYMFSVPALVHLALSSQPHHRFPVAPRTVVADAWACLRRQDTGRAPLLASEGGGEATSDVNACLRSTIAGCFSIAAFGAVLLVGQLF